MDLRVFVVGDSFVAGVGDPEHRGWVGRVAACTHPELTLYNLGVRRETSTDVRRRWPGEVAVRRAAGCAEGLVVSFGVNDTTVEAGRPRVEPARSVANLRGVADDAAAAGLGLLVVGPPPIADPAQNLRIGALDGLFREACADVPYVSVFDDLVADRVWMDEVRDGDGAHPGAAGYELLAELVLPVWRRWIGGV